MKQIQKFKLTFTDAAQSIAMPAEIDPKTGETLSAPLLRGHLILDNPFVWALVDPTAATVARFFVVIADGKPVPDGAQFVDACEYQEFSWNIFETAS